MLAGRWILNEYQSLSARAIAPSVWMGKMPRNIRDKFQLYCIANSSSIASSLPPSSALRARIRLFARQTFPGEVRLAISAWRDPAMSFLITVIQFHNFRLLGFKGRRAPHPCPSRLRSSSLSSQRGGWLYYFVIFAYIASFLASAF